MPWQEKAFEHVSPNKGEQLFMAASTLVIRLCACVRNWAGQFSIFFSISLKFRSRRKVFLDRLSRKRSEELLVYFNVFKTPVSKRMFREFV